MSGWECMWSNGWAIVGGSLVLATDDELIIRSIPLLTP